MHGQDQQGQRGQQPENDSPGGEAEQEVGRAPPPTGPPLSGQPLAAYARWGILPPRLQQALQSFSAADVPLRYRRWLEDYHRRAATER